MGYIYKITNDINEKVYIGQTTMTLKRRWNEHLKCAKYIKNMHIARAINKYGAEHFNITTLEECSDDILDEREIYWISQYDSYHNGYNCTLGGDGFKRLNHALMKELWDDGKSIDEIVDITGYKFITIRKFVRQFDDYLDRCNDIMYRHTCHQVSKYDLDGNYIQTYKSIYDACRDMNCGLSTIGNSIQRGYPVCVGYQWRLGCDKNNIGKPKPSANKKAVVQLDLDNKVINIYESVSEASRQNNMYSGSLSKIIRRSTIANGFKWMYYNDYIQNGENF